MPQAKVLVGRVIWVADDATARSQADTAIIAVPPEHQPKILDELLTLPNIKRITLEKPLAPTPAEAEQMMEKLEKSGKEFRIDYIFRFTDWGEKLLVRPITEALTIEWQFMAHHFANDLMNWRRDGEQGGGAMHFYGIHFIALLAELGYTEVISSTLSTESGRWEATFSGHNLPPCHLVVDSKSSDTRFVVAVGDTVVTDQSTVFVHLDKNWDMRVPYIQKFMASFNEPALSWYQSVITLWSLSKQSIDRSTPMIWATLQSLI